ncbi:beta-lactamase family protein [Bacillaceae bacterium SIJ1]|uniref:serine hydrolase domain-containing protein n=1 Tax=Litoribacterium kuwaitense TaxID=1398745 RepID=UPI0013ED504F|nr:serine hydrolase domain-containing protein [Litoribacterium kuwaitense]NGP46182.1 beta-lactamase family protein [Litoribacterium kuwaitense]
MKEALIHFLQKEVAQSHIPGAAMVVSHEGKVIVKEAVGHRMVYPYEAPMEVDTVFDLASLTKVVATMPAVLKLIDDGEIRLDDPVPFFLPDFAQNGKKEVTLKHLLTHTSGLPAHQPFYKKQWSAEQVMTQIFAKPLEYRTGTKVVYSDIGFITLHQVIEKVTEQSFSSFVQEQLFNPLMMYDTQFNPDKQKCRFAATEFCEARQAYKCGDVHDENAELLGGVSGHAGLFSTLNNLGIFASMIENHGVYQGKQILSEAALSLARQSFTMFAPEQRGLGWMLKSESLSSCGDLFSASSYGHTGFTGTSIWFDPAVKLHVILLTNRVHFGRQPHILRLRARLHNLIRAYFS